MHRFFRHPRRGSLLLLALIAMGAAALADVLFFAAPAGWTIGLFALALCAAVLLRPGSALSTRGGRVLAGLVAGLAVATLLQRSTLGAVLLFMGVGALALVQRAGWSADAAEWARRLATLAAALPSRLPRDLHTLYRRARRRPLLGALRGTVVRWLIPLALAGVFVALFAVANPLIEGWLRVAGEWIDALPARVSAVLDPKRLFLWAAVLFSAWALLRVRARRRAGTRAPWRLLREAFARTAAPVSPPTSPSAARAAPSPTAPAAPLAPPAAGATKLPIGAVYRSAPPEPPPGTPREAWPGRALLERCLVVFNLVFAVQTLLDASYLFGGAHLPEGTTWAAYAHRGAYPLVATALLAALFVLATFRAGLERAHSPLARRLVYAWIAQNVFLVFTAAWRLSLYVEAYGLTRLRLAAGLWMVLVAVGLLWIVARIAASRTNAWLVRANALTVLGLLYACSFVPLDGLVAWHNVRFCAEVAGPGRIALDLDYLDRLGSDALPALRWVEPRLPPERSVAVRTSIALQDEILRARLRDPRGWTLRDAGLLAPPSAPTEAFALGREGRVSW